MHWCEHKYSYHCSYGHWCKWVILCELFSLIEFI